MKSAQPRLRDYLEHIVDAVRRIAAYTDGMNARSFRDDQLVQDAVIRNIEVIGEAARKIRTSHPEFADAHPEVPFDAAYQMRNAVAHGYFAVDLDVVWATVITDLPALGEAVQSIIDPAR